jgi:drug/metabolite transporter (DMT)-like permease
MQRAKIIYHLLAILIVLIWGITFVNTKVLLQYGMMPEEIFVVRFLIAYICIWTISPRKLFSATFYDELLMLLLGMTGGSAYFICENFALTMSYTTNVSFIVCTAPLLTTILALLFIRDVKASPKLIGGSLTALAGVAIVIFNGRFVLHLNPLGDMLALGASLCWAIYSILMRGVANRYGAVFVTRKVFFYGLVTMLPVFIFRHWHFPLSGFLVPQVWGNFVFLGFIASFACFVLWSLAIKKIGALSTSNYVYLNPITTVVASAIVLHERFTPIAGIGAALILIGIYLANTAKFIGNK